MKIKFNAIIFPGLLVGILITNTCDAQKLSSSKVPAAVKESFTKSFPGIKMITWEMEDKNYEAGFKQDGKNMSAVFDAAGALLETETAIKITELPASATNYISQHYKGSVIKEAAMIKKSNGEINYEAEINHKDYLFDSKGEFIKTAKD